MNTQILSIRSLQIVILAIFLSSSTSSGFLLPTPSIWAFPASICSQSADDNADDGSKYSSDRNDDSSGSQEEQAIEASVRYDDGGSNLTDRFKYKVNALMGNFDPVEGVVDDERADGNILNAILEFPIRYTFNVVGRTSGDDKHKEEYIEGVKKVIFATSGDGDILCKVSPRGKNFTKVQCEANVQSAAMINMIYDEIDRLEATVMRF